MLYSCCDFGASGRGDGGCLGDGYGNGYLLGYAQTGYGNGSRQGYGVGYGFSYAGDGGGDGGTYEPYMLVLGTDVIGVSLNAELQ